MNTENYGTGSPTAWATSECTFCANRLPCGVCRLMQMMCPLAVKPYDVTVTPNDVTWKNPYEVTCKAEA